MKRKFDWFLWRSNECLTEEVQFDIGCMRTSYVTTRGPIQGSYEKNEVLLLPIEAKNNVEEKNENDNTDYGSKEEDEEERKWSDYGVDSPLLWPRFKK